MTRHDDFDELGNLKAFALGCVMGITNSNEPDERKIERIKNNLEKYINRREELEK